MGAANQAQAQDREERRDPEGTVEGKGAMLGIGGWLEAWLSP